MAVRIQIVAILATASLFLLVFELVRRRRLSERYALLWLLSAVVLLALAVWKGFLLDVSRAIGIYYAPSALFVIAFGFVLILLLHFSLATSGLAEQTKVLAQQLGLLQQRVEELESAAATSAERPSVALDAGAGDEAALERVTSRY